MQQSINNIKNIFCVGRNYKMHAAELGNAVPTEPMFFMKPNHALTHMNGNTVVLSNNKGAIHYEAELIIHIGNTYKKGMQVDEIIDQVALGIDLTLRDVQTKLKAEGYPWLAAKGFRNSAFISTFIPTSTLDSLNLLEFQLIKNGTQVQYGRVQDMIFSLQEILDYCDENYGLGAGDIIYTGTPSGVAPIADGDHLILKLRDQIVGDCIIKLG